MSEESEKFQNTINEIDPPVGAKERMLANTKRKAAQAQTETSGQPEVSGQTETSGQVRQGEKPGKTFSIYRFALPVAAAAAVIIGIGVWSMNSPIRPSVSPTGSETEGVTQESPEVVDERFTAENSSEGGNVGYDVAASPYRDAADAAELSAWLGFTIDAPAEAESVVYSSYLEDTAYISFSYQWEGYYVLQAGKNIEYLNTADGSGIVTTTIDGVAVQAFTGEDEISYLAITWEKDGRSYYLYGWADTSNPETMAAIYRQI